MVNKLITQKQININIDTAYDVLIYWQKRKLINNSFLRTCMKFSDFSVFFFFFLLLLNV